MSKTESALVAIAPCGCEMAARLQVDLDPLSLDAKAEKSWAMEMEARGFKIVTRVFSASLALSNKTCPKHPIWGTK
jgi:hypothetical protein